MADFDSYLAPNTQSDHPIATITIGETNIYPIGSFGGADSSPPVIANLSPTPGEISGSRYSAMRTPIEFDVYDTAPGLRIVVVTLEYAAVPGVKYVVHDGSNFNGDFASTTSVRTAIEGGYHYKVLPIRGWRGHFNLWVYALDQDGNMEGSLP